MMECFTLFRSHLTMSGIVDEQQIRQPFKFNFKNVTIIIFNCLYGITTIKLLDDSNTFEEYADYIYQLLCIIGFAMFYSYVVWNAPELFGLTKTTEDMINKSKHYTHYTGPSNFNYRIPVKTKHSWNFPKKYENSSQYLCHDWLQFVGVPCTNVYLRGISMGFELFIFSIRIGAKSRIAANVHRDEPTNSEMDKTIECHQHSNMSTALHGSAFYL